ncbi:hypothetical protein ILUMI_12295 [Ignelater luminosus]|uniref:Uncharacterized protein n=1 Tax=Ignelater luminosus TaxID=2038154 RepID=A0A8K0G9P4_IGNLU|nr:hypothetical protein ILUMI_12295 [Ignelater luminosus]
MENVLSGKVVILGDQGVGKTSLILRYLEKEFDRHISPTIGASYFSCSVAIKNVIVKLQVWDTAGQERFKAMTPMFYRNANIAFLAFDITRPETFQNIQNWVTELNGNIHTHVIMIIIGNKSDLSNDRKVPREEAIRYSNGIGATYYECSSLKNLGVDRIFESAAIKLLKHLDPYFNNYIDCENSIDAPSCSLSATDVGNVVVLGRSKDNIAHGTTVSNKCC